ncbi:ABC transporter ATP-binding protein [Fervidibacillus halotolerans]|uniref:ABC transporter ATP-binding protein n=1 Tax=Fervidibacillus halotolerans TaxID=2980027 RepID=A0A9E8RXM2_9BACI|nr:ABC transporter ATP-binding protein [Fervidibacillus halotolerans]WAA11926.1 ABC transporter ATP-binding protein [Fervidibacillus halotolerans]
MPRPIIELDKVTKKYDDQYAVDHLTLSIKKGEIFGLLGPNGAGKTTTILMLLGLSEPTSGRVRVDGIDSTRNPIEVKKEVGYLPDDLGFYQHMTGFENLMYTAALNGIPERIAKERAKDLLEKVNLLDVADKKTGKYSRGMRQRLGLADVLMKDPKVIILDEPTLGIDPEGVREFLQLIRRLNVEEHITVLLSSHHLHQVQQICDRVGIFVNGKLLAEGTTESLSKQLFLQDTYHIHVSASPLSEELVQKLEAIPNVNKVEIDQHSMNLYCKEDVSATISKVIVESGASLYGIRKKNYGLDEIYHRYFEGREADGNQ